MNTSILKFKRVLKSKAKKDISSYLLQERKKGVKKLSTFDVVWNTKLPAKQVESVLGDFKKENKIKEI